MSPERKNCGSWTFDSDVNSCGMEYPVHLKGDDFMFLPFFLYINERVERDFDPIPVYCLEVVILRDTI